MFGRIRSGGHGAGKVLSLHRYYNTASRKSGRKAYEIILDLSDMRPRPGDVIPDWLDRHHTRLTKLRRT